MQVIEHIIAKHYTDRMKKSAFLVTVFSGVAASMLTGCTVARQENLGLDGSKHNLISHLQPDRGEAGLYHVGEPYRIQIETRTDGYLTLMALNNKGEAQVLVQNAMVKAGKTVFPRPEDGAIYTAGLPLGSERVRAIFTRVKPATAVVLGGVYDAGRWNDVTNSYLSAYKPADRDVQETYFVVDQPVQ